MANRGPIDWSLKDREAVLAQCCRQAVTWPECALLFHQRTGILISDNAVRLKAERSKLKLGADAGTDPDESQMELLLAHVSERLPRLPSMRPHKAKKRKRLTPESAVTIWGDFHIGAWVDPESTASLCHYSWDVFQKRFGRLIHVIQKLGELKSAPTPTLWILLIGDMVDGANVFPGHAYHADRALATIDQVFDGSAVVSEGIQELSRNYQAVHVVGVPGNHGRIGRKGELPYNDSLDVLFYRILALRLEQLKHVHFHISTSPWAAVNVDGHNFAIAHGDQIRGTMSIPFYGGARAAGRLSTLTEIPLSALVLGHHHSVASFDVNDTEVIFNGSLVGGSDLSTNRMFLASRPKQVLLHVHPGNGITDKHVIYLGERPRLTVKTNSVLTPSRSS